MLSERNESTKNHDKKMGLPTTLKMCFCAAESTSQTFCEPVRATRLSLQRLELDRRDSCFIVLL